MTEVPCPPCNRQFLRLWRSALPAITLGALSTLAFAPFGLWPLLWVSHAGLFLLCRTAPSAKTASGLGFLFGLGSFGTGISWVFVSLAQFSGLPVAAAAAATLLFCGFFALFPALVCALFYRLASRHSLIRQNLIFAGLWTLGEILRGYLFSGFPWLSSGYAHAPITLTSPLAGFAPVIGVYGTSLMSVLISSSFATILYKFYHDYRSGSISNSASACQHKRVPFLSPVRIVAVICLTGIALQSVDWTQPHGKELKVSLVQGNIPQGIKWNPEHFLRTLDLYAELVEKSQGRLIFLPETAFPTLFDNLPSAYLVKLQKVLEVRRAELIFGIAANNDHGYTNSSIVLSADGTTKRYDKSHLVPFGEFTPLGFQWFARQLNIPLSGFSPGTRKPAPLNLSGIDTAFTICYEDVFGEEVAQRSEIAGMIINQSNTAWFGRSLAQDQHLQMAQMRAMENGRPILRATNTGATAVIDPKGRVVATLPHFTQATLETAVQPYQGSTPYQHWRNLPALILALLLALSAKSPWSKKEITRHGMQ